MDQLVIKIILLIGIAVLAVLIVLPGRGARRQALRRIALLLGAIVGAIAVIFPQLTNDLAKLFGVGRGADLLLYGMVFAFIWSVVTARINRSKVDMQLTELARSLAIVEAEKPGPPEA